MLIAFGPASLADVNSHMAMVLGRPRAIHREDCTTPPPLDCDFPLEPSQTVPIATNHARQAPSSITSTIFWINLSHKVHDMLSMRAHKSRRQDYSRVQSLHQQVQSLLSDLPAALRPDSPNMSWDNVRPQLITTRERIITASSIFLTALHRPCITTHTESRKAAIDAALSLLQAQQRLYDMISEPQYKLFGYSFYTIDSALFLMSMLTKEPIADAELVYTIHNELEKAIGRITLMKERSHIAKTGEQILRQCYQDLQFQSTPPMSIGSGRSFADTDTLDGGLQDQVMASMQDFGIYSISSAASYDMSTGPFDAGFISMDQLYSPWGTSFEPGMLQQDSGWTSFQGVPSEAQYQGTGSMGAESGQGTW